MKDKFYPSPPNFFKIGHTVFGVIIFQDFAAPSLQYDPFDLQTGQFQQMVSTLRLTEFNMTLNYRNNIQMFSKSDQITVMCSNVSRKF